LERSPAKYSYVRSYADFHAFRDGISSVMGYWLEQLLRMIVQQKKEMICKEWAGQQLQAR
jgi:hypothetical protein